MLAFNVNFFFILLCTPHLLAYNNTQKVSLKAGQEWRCSFRANICGIENQKKMPANFTHLPDGQLFGEQGLYYLESAACTKNGARLMTPYFDFASQVRAVCLTIRYVIFGKGIQQLSALKQDRVNAMLWSDRNPATGRWQQKRIDATVHPKHPARFFIEARLSRLLDRAGFLAISEIGLRDSYCLP